MDPLILGVIGATVAVHTMLRLHRRRAGVIPKNTQFSVYEQLRNKYRSFEVWLGPMCILAFLSIAYVLYKILLIVSNWRTKYFTDAVYAYPIFPAAWALIALFCSIVLALPVVLLLTRLILMEDYWEYLRYCEQRHTRDKIKISRKQVVAYCILLGGATILALDCYVYVTDRELVINRLLGLGERRYAFSAIKSLRTAPTFVAPNGTIVHRRQYDVEFSDSTIWNFESDPISLEGAAERQQLFQFLADKTKLPIIETATIH